MSKTHDLVQLGSLVAATQGWSAAKAFKAYVASDADKAAIANKARELLSIFPAMSGACALMSAGFAAHLERDLDLPIQVVAGTLSVEGKPVFGDGQPFDGPAIFGTNNLDWDGHVWVMIGGHVADISIFRTAYSASCPPRLGRHIVHTFGGGKGLYFDAWRHTRRLGLDYHPQYVLSEAEVTRLVAGAHTAIVAARSSATPSNGDEVMSQTVWDGGKRPDGFPGKSYGWPSARLSVETLGADGSPWIS
jgi:hypothetical protein